MHEQHDTPFYPTITEKGGYIYQGIPGYEGHLQKELALLAKEAGSGNNFQAWGSFVTAHLPPDLARSVFWHRNLWLKPTEIHFNSIGEAAKALRAIQGAWASVPYTQFRRAHLIAEKLPKVPNKKRPFPWKLPATPLGSWALRDANTLIASPACTSPFPGGIIEFEEDREGPPSRAYLKLWEALVRLRHMPAKGETCLDAGASPGGWTWALSRLGASVTACDRAPLDERIAAMPGVRFICSDAFSIKPKDFGPVDWIFSDVICYPGRLFDWVNRWLDSGLCSNFVCTIKMQGSTESSELPNGVDFDTPRRFASIPGSLVVHLHHNKHELTWMKVPNAPLEKHPHSADN